MLSFIHNINMLKGDLNYEHMDYLLSKVNEYKKEEDRNDFEKQ